MCLLDDAVAYFLSVLKGSYVTGGVSSCRIQWLLHASLVMWAAGFRGRPCFRFLICFCPDRLLFMDEKMDAWRDRQMDGFGLNRTGEEILTCWVRGPDPWKKKKNLKFIVHSPRRRIQQFVGGAKSWMHHECSLSHNCVEQNKYWTGKGQVLCWGSTCTYWSHTLTWS